MIKTLTHFIVLILVSVMIMPLQAQTIKQKGVAYRYNGKNTRTSLGGVYIKAITANNGEVSDEKTGIFELTLNNLEMGAPIGNVQVTKQGMMVFNQQAVDEWSVRRDPLCLILCDTDEFQKQKDNLIAIGRNEAKKKYDKKLTELKKLNDTQQLKIEEYNNKLHSLEEEYQNALKHMDEYADVFARIDESEVDTIAQKAIELFHKGEIEESLRLFEQGNYMKKLDEALRIKAQAQELRQAADSAEVLANKDIEGYANNIKVQVAACKVNNDFKKAGELLKDLANKINTLETIWNYAIFCHSQNDLKNAEVYYLKYKELLNKSNDMGESEKLHLSSAVQNNLANLYLKIQRYAESEAMCKSALEIRKRLAESNPTVYEPDVAMAQNSLASLYRKVQHYAESEAMYKAALEICEHLAESNPAVYEPDVAMTQNNLANLYGDIRRYAESEAMYKSSLEIRKRLAESNPTVYEPDVAMTLYNLANLYDNIRRYAESEAMCKYALEIYERLAKANPAAFEPDVAMTQNSLANLYSTTQRYGESEAMYKAALKIRERLAESNSAVYEPDVAMTQNNLANLYSKIQRYDESEAMCKSALEIRKRLAESNPAVYEPDVAMTQNSLASLYRKVQRHAESEAMYKAALETYERLAEANPAVYEPDVAMTQYNLANLYFDTQRYGESEVMYKSALEVYERLAEANPAVYEPNVAKTQNTLAILYRYIQRYDESEMMCKSALEIYERLAKSNPAVYEPDVAATQYNLAILYSATQHYTESEKMYKKCIETFSNLYTTNPHRYSEVLAECYYWLGRTALSMEKVSESSEYFKQSLNIARSLVKNGNDTNIYLEALSFLSKISSQKTDYVSAYSFNEEMLPILKKYYDRDSNNWEVIYVKELINKSFYAILLRKFEEGELYSLEALKVDSTNHIAYANLAAALLFQGKVDKAEKLYRQYSSEFKEGFLSDFAEFERLDIIPEERKTDVERIKAMLKEE